MELVISAALYVKSIQSKFIQVHVYKEKMADKT